MKIVPAVILLLVAILIHHNFHLLYRDGLAVSLFRQDSKTITWDSTSLRRISPADRQGFYPRMLQLKDNNLICVYASGGNIVLQKSMDAGRSWQQSGIVATKEDGVNMDTPELLQIKNGDILVCYNGRPQKALRGSTEPGKQFDIRVKVSHDSGMSWTNEQVLFKAGESFKNGCWEPSALQLPSGEIQLFFSDESIYTNSDEQNISMLSSTDNGYSWTTKPVMISFRSNSRDGMPVPVWLPDENEVAIAIEDPGNKNFKPYIIHSPAMGKWNKLVDGNDSKRVNALSAKLPDSVYAGAPYLRRLSTGVTVLSYQSTEGRSGTPSDKNAMMVVATGDSHASHFDHTTIPFNVPDGYHALWNSLCVLTDNSIIAVTSTNGYSKSVSEIWMIRGRIE